MISHPSPIDTNLSPFFHTLAIREDSYSELFTGSGQVRDHWQLLLNEFNTKDENGFRNDYERVKTMRHDDGATINPFEIQTEQTTPWALDLLPVTISSGEWKVLEAGITQRALLLETILADIYGPQELLNSGNIPAELVFNNPSFLHVCHNMQPIGSRYLTLYAVDLYRSPDGRFQVVQDIGANPAGIGYALENRIVMSRVFGDLYHEAQIRRLAPFFQEFHNSLLLRASLRQDDPRIVLMTPGPDSPLYFEHALLSRYLDYPLVEGQDLTVRNGKVFLKKLDGLEAVEAMFRHIDDLQSDPFALRRETTSGVAGLIEVCREQNIEIVNPIGSGFINTPALRTLLPELCTHLLDEELTLENHPCWWGGSERGRDYCLEHREHLQFIPALNPSAGPANRDTDMGSVLQAAPSEWLGTRPLQPSSAPVWNGEALENNFVLFRFFACATENGFAVMPGGLAITSDSCEKLADGNPEELQSKDVWVFSDTPVKPISMLHSLSVIPEFKRSSGLQSRVADNLLWLGRYLERAEGLIRLLRSIYRRFTREERPEDIPELPFLLSIVSARNIIPGSEDQKSEGELYLELFHHLHEALFSREKTGSIITILKQVQTTARNVRDRLSVDSFRLINKLEQFTESKGNDPIKLLDQTLFTLHGFSGLAMEGMTRGLGWRFLDMGRRIERAIHQASLIRVALPVICETTPYSLQALLETSDSLMTYRSRYRSAFQLAPVLDLLLSDESNPKSLAFQLNQLADHISHMPQQFEKRYSSPEERNALELLTDIRLLDLTAAHCEEDTISNPELIEFLTDMESRLKECAQQITAHYLSRIPTTPHYTLITGSTD